MHYQYGIPNPQPHGQMGGSVVKSVTPDIIVWRNGAWCPLYHSNHFYNMLREHIRKIKGYEAKRLEEIRIRLEMEQRHVVRVNGLAFRYKHEKRNHHEIPQQKQAA